MRYWENCNTQNAFRRRGHDLSHLSEPERSVQVAFSAEKTSQMTKSLVCVMPLPPNPMPLEQAADGRKNVAYGTQ